MRDPEMVLASQKPEINKYQVDHTHWSLPMMCVVGYLLAGQALHSALQHPLKHFTDNAANLGLT